MFLGSDSLFVCFLTCCFSSVLHEQFIDWFIIRKITELYISKVDCLFLSREENNGLDAFCTIQTSVLTVPLLWKKCLRLFLKLKASHLSLCFVPLLWDSGHSFSFSFSCQKSFPKASVSQTIRICSYRAFYLVTGRLWLLLCLFLRHSLKALAIEHITLGVLQHF